MRIARDYPLSDSLGKCTAWLCILCGVSSISGAAAADIYVSPGGSDTAGDGSQAHPVATLTKAQQIARRELVSTGYE